MGAAVSRKAQRARWQREIAGHLEQLPRQYAALERLAELPPPAGDTRGSAVHRAFESLREAGVISAALCRRLVRAQVARSTIEHEYLGSSAGDVHRAAELVHEAAREFLARYRPWIEPYLTQDLHQTSTAP